VTKLILAGVAELRSAVDFAPHPVVDQEAVAGPVGALVD